MPPLKLDVSGRRPSPQAKGQRSGEATVEVVAPGMSETFAERVQLRLSLAAVAREAFSLAGRGSLEGHAMLATFGAFDASNIQGLANAQTRALQDLFNPPRVRPTLKEWTVEVQAEGPR